MIPERNTTPSTVPPPPTPQEMEAQRVQGVQNQWDMLARQQVIPSPLAQNPVESIDLKPPILEADRKREKEKKKKRVIQEWARSLWLRRSLVATRAKAQEKAENSGSKTVRGLWKAADVAIGVALSAPNRAMIVPKNKSKSYKGYEPV